VPKNSQIKTIEEITGVPRVATEYPNTSRKFFASKGKQVEILTVRGATELAPILGLAEIIVDVSTTGETLAKNNLRQVALVLESSCRFVCNKIAYRTFEREVRELMDTLKDGGE
jgi:ATP phosphoribosyltransferase